MSRILSESQGEIQCTVSVSNFSNWIKHAKTDKEIDQDGTYLLEINEFGVPIQSFPNSSLNEEKDLRQPIKISNKHKYNY